MNAAPPGLMTNSQEEKPSGNRNMEKAVSAQAQTLTFAGKGFCLFCGSFFFLTDVGC